MNVAFVVYNGNAFWFMTDDHIVTDKTYVYTYDKAGNRTGMYAFPNHGAPAAHWLASGMGEQLASYGYTNSTWGDLLTNYDGTTISYDVSGNPKNWKNVSSLSWMGNRLTSISIDGLKEELALHYNADGIRIGKTYWDSNGTPIYYSYVLDGKRIISETVTGAENYTLYYLYGADGSVEGFIYGNAYYYFQKNLQGDIIRICNCLGETVTEYAYDAWGIITSITGSMASTIGRMNPFRYRGYYYDTETGWYYLNARYYDPNVGRFLSPDPNVCVGKFDENAGLIGYNVYVYCANNPIKNIDPTGEFLISTAVLIGVGIGALIGGVSGGVYGYNKAVKNNVPEGQRWKYVVGYGLGGVVIGGVIGGFVGYGVGVALGAKASSGLVIRSVSKALRIVIQKHFNPATHTIIKLHRMIHSIFCDFSRQRSSVNVKENQVHIWQNIEKGCFTDALCRIDCE